MKIKHKIKNKHVAKVLNGMKVTSDIKSIKSQLCIINIFMILFNDVCLVNVRC